MSIFGKMDAETIPTNPYFVAAGDYSATVTKAEFRNNRDQEKQLFIEYTIDDEESPFLDSKVGQYFTLVDSEMTPEIFATLPAGDQKKIRQRLASLKRTLCGNDGNDSQPGLGVNPEDLNSDSWDPAVLLGTKVDLSISNYGSGNPPQGVNVRWANIVQ
jgi:hypothetical protein